MTIMSTRPGCEKDEARLAEIKSRYVQMLYRGFMTDAFIKTQDSASFEAQMHHWLAGPYETIVGEGDGEANCFIVWQKDPEDERCAIIEDWGVIPFQGMGENETLFSHALEKIAKDYQYARLWLLKENLRARFFFERLEFRCDGRKGRGELDGQELSLISYTCKLEHYMK